MGTNSAPENPFIGPRAFGVADRDLFFGREQEASDLLSLTIAHSVVLFCAKSGAGKTSLVNAGLIPLLEKEGFEVLSGRVAGLVPTGIELDEITNLYVYNSLLSFADTALRPEDLLGKSLATFLEERTAVREREVAEAPRALVLDQFEELFTVYPRHRQERDAFFEQLGGALERDTLLRIVLVLREEYVPYLHRYSRVLPEWPLTSYRMERLGRAAALEAIKRPLARSGRSFSPGVAETLVDDLLKVRVSRFTEQGAEVLEVAGEFVEPVHLQIVCEGLWSALPPEAMIVTQDHLRESGTVDSALRQFYEDGIRAAHGETLVAERALRRWCGKALITPLGMRGRVPRGEDESGGIPNPAVEVLERQRLIRAEQWSGAPWYELTHDRLIEPILASNEQAEREHEREELERAAREETRKERRRAISLILVACVAALVFAGLFALSYIQSQRQTNEADREARNAMALQYAARVPGALAADSELGLLLAMESISVTYSVDGSYKVEAYAALWQALDSPPYVVLRGHTGSVNSAHFDPQGQQILTASADKTARLWDLAGEPVAILVGHKAAVLTARFSSDGRYVLTASEDSTARLWSMSGDLVAEFLGHDGPVNDGVFGPSVEGEPSSELILTASADTTARVWDTAGNPIATLSGHTGPVNSAVFNTAGDLIVTASADGTARLWSPDGTPVATLAGHTAPVNYAEFSPDGELVLTASEDGTARLWNLMGRSVASISGHTKPISHAAFSPDGDRVVTASADGTARLWDVQGRPVVILAEHSGPVNHVAFSPDGVLIATASADGNIRLWHRDGQALGALSGRNAEALYADFSPDSQVVVTGKAGGAARVHYISIEQMMALARTRVTRSLTPEELQTYGGETLLVPTPVPTERPTATTAAPSPPPLPIASVPVFPDMVFIPAGAFQMGSSQEEIDYALWLCQEYQDSDRYECERAAFEDEYPVRAVYLDDFFIDVHEVTNGDYRECVEAGICAPPKEVWSGTRDRYFGEPEYDDYPVIWVSWNDAQTYCEWAGKRLPTEAEWEKAARGTDGRLWPWGDEWSEDRLNCCESIGNTTPVGSYPSGVSPYGVQDMAGNVWEWVSDCFQYKYYSLGPDSNPTGPICGADADVLRVLRGGSWSYPPRYARTADRSPNLSSNRYPNIGFRCAM